MIDPYKMVFINVVGSLIVLLGTLVYRFIYPKKDINLFTLLLIISILPITSIFRPGAYESGDFNIHIYRIMSFYDSLLEGNLMPSWAGELNATYGNPLFIFNYSLPYYFVSLFHLLGSSFIDGLKIYLATNMYLSGIFMYLWIKKLTKNNLAAFTSAIFYLFNPYHLIDVHFKATPGEATIFTLAPLLFLFLTYYLQDKKIIFLILISLTTQLLFLAHPLVALTIFGISVFFVLFYKEFKNNIKEIIATLSSLIFGAFASVYAWASFIIFASFIFPKPGEIVWQFDRIDQLLFSPWRLGFLFQGPNGELSWLIGYTQIFVLILMMLLLIKNKLAKKIKLSALFWILIIILVIFLLLPISKPIWLIVPRFLLELESNRLLVVLSFSTSVLAGYLSLQLSKKREHRIFLYILIFLTVGYTILNWGHRRVLPNINDSYLRERVPFSTITEGTTAYFLNNKWADINNFWFTNIPKTHLDILQGKGRITQIKRTSTVHEYIIEAGTPILIKENTLFYPGWSLKSNYKTVGIFPGKRGVINAYLPKGVQFIQLQYNDILPYKITKLISFSSFIFLLVTILLYFIKKILLAKGLLSY